MDITCTATPSSETFDSSIPRISAIPCWTAASSAGSHPAVVSWSVKATPDSPARSEEHTSELQSRFELVCRLLLEKKKAHRRAEDGCAIKDYLKHMETV